MKAIVIGPSLSGKTTLIRHLRSNTSYNLSEIDELLTELNGGEYPVDETHKRLQILPKVVGKVLGSDDIVFFTNTDYFTEMDLKKAKEAGFKIIQLDINLEELQKRNKSRVENEGYQDMSQWLEGMLNYQKDIDAKRLVDKKIDSSTDTEVIASKLLSYLENSKN